MAVPMRLSGIPMKGQYLRRDAPIENIWPGEYLPDCTPQQMHRQAELQHFVTGVQDMEYETMNSRSLSHQLIRPHHQRRRLAPIVSGDVTRRAPAPAAIADKAARQADWQAFVRLAVVLIATGLATAVLHWMQ